MKSCYSWAMGRRADNPVAALVASFEVALGVRFTINDYAGRIRQFLPADRCFHANRFCLCVKSKATQNKQCGRFDTQIVPARLAQDKEPLWKLCHGGILELAVPLWEGEVMCGRIYAGQFRWDESRELPHAVCVQRARPRALSLGEALYRALPVLTPERMDALIPVLAAFARELMSLVGSAERLPQREQTRQWRIENWLGLRFTSPIGLKDLAQALGLSVSRTGQVVRTLFGKPFADVLRDVRMAHARDLLTHTAFPVHEVAERCGFPDPGYFHRLFKQKHGVTPLAYRRAHQQDLPV